jgi:hypothetical protein
MKTTTEIATSLLTLTDGQSHSQQCQSEDNPFNGGGGGGVSQRTAQNARSKGKTKKAKAPAKKAKKAGKKK